MRSTWASDFVISTSLIVDFGVLAAARKSASFTAITASRARCPASPCFSIASTMRRTVLLFSSFAYSDITTDQRTSQSYYTIRIAMAPEQVARLGEVKLVPGMPVEAFVKTGDRTVMSYLMKPLSDQLNRAFRE